MINSDLLGNRLTAFKNNEPLSEEGDHLGGGTNQFYQSDNIPIIVSFLSTLINFGFLFLKSAAYGFAVKTVFETDWTFWPVIAVGFSIELILSTLLKPFSKDK